MSEIKKFPYTDILGWSVSRYDKFSLCKRMYFYDYYAKFDTEYTVDRINFLKKLTSAPLETGNLVHDAIKVLLERLLRSSQPIDKKKFQEFARRRSDENCAAKVFSEVYHNEISALDTGVFFNSAWAMLENFLASPKFQWITEKAITNRENWVIEPPGYGETRINDMKAYCKVDFLFPVEGKIHILDWKTGKADEVKHRKQLLGYSTWACYHFSVSAHEIIPAAVYLNPVYRELVAVFDPSEVAEFVSTVRKETGEMYGYCRDHSKNIPKQKAEFPKTGNSRICQFCNYRSLCK
jgi:hypothetical protein